jgi:hypothetical protein
MFCASFQFYLICIFLIRGDLVSKHEQLLILMGIDASTLCICKFFHGRQSEVCERFCN